MTDEVRLREIEERANAATEGPWLDYDNVHGAHIVRTTDAHGGLNVAAVDLAHAVESFHERNANTAFIAHAREDIPWLLAEVAALQERLRSESKDGEYAPVEAGEWIRPPLDAPFGFECCDCGLVHALTFDHDAEGRVIFAAERDDEATHNQRAKRLNEGRTASEEVDAWERLMQTFSDHHRGEHDWSAKDPYDCSVCHLHIQIYAVAIRTAERARP